MARSELILGKPQGKHRVRPVYLAGKGARAIFYVWQPDGKGTGWYFRLQGHTHRQGDRSQGFPNRFKRCSDAMIAGSAAWLRLGIYQ